MRATRDVNNGEQRRLTGVAHDGQAELLDVDELEETGLAEDDVILRQLLVAVGAQLQRRVLIGHQHVLDGVRQNKVVFKHLT